MQTEQIIQLIEAVAASPLTEFEYCEGDVRVSLKAGAGPKINATTNQEITVEPAALKEEQILKSPLVGTFYSAPSEDAKPYVALGDKVKKGQILGLIETMKLMNEVECDRDGVVATVLIENEQVVEYGQPLFAIE